MISETTYDGYGMAKAYREMLETVSACYALSLEEAHQVLDDLLRGLYGLMLSMMQQGACEDYEREALNSLCRKMPQATMLVESIRDFLESADESMMEAETDTPAQRLLKLLDFCLCASSCS